ncbi:MULTISPECIES: DUF485 domain-containing protein [Burkholderiaceae]|uniref:DUF485 domain-containing protein n=1 Tax=Burkholderiaceae TaxID=119060 RepID=UPI0011D3CB21|nr:DUF485 domain-containing protein [Ralstonia mannitolilytica]TXI80866.1 MAG: DUF485 domain-containing protein [Cupriavidus sp.]CAJ0891572.1 hypothetical protein R76727_04279 [Ralstonia mannitolilytica]
MPKSTDYHALFDHPQFAELVRQRRIVMVRLFAISMAFFFSLPLISTFAPQLLLIRITPSTTLGLWYNVAQYFIGGAIAWRYAVQLRRLDAMAAALTTGAREAMAPRPAGAVAQRAVA